MDAATFETLIARSEKLASRRPRQYRWGVFALAALGYLYLALVVALLLALLLVSIASVLYLKAIAIKLIFVVGAALLVVLRALWVRLSPPAGIELTRASAPELHALLDELRHRLNAPRLHQVLLTPEFNAGITQLPRLGLFGWHRNYLVIGLPLIKALTVEQFEAVLAHELGHLSRGHARAGNWIYRLRVIWQRLDAAFSRHSHWGSILVQPFFKRYVPFFTAASFPLARANEYEADAASLRITSARSAAQALTSVHIVGAFLAEKYWPAIQAAAKDLAQPAIAPFRDFAVGAINDLSPEELQRWLRTALGKQTSHADTHPCLADRLKALGMEAEFAPPPAAGGAERLLGPSLAQWQNSFDAGWRERVQEIWKKIHEQTQSKRARMVELRSKRAAADLDEVTALEFATLEEEVGAGPDAALLLRRTLLEKHPESLPVRFALARQLLQRGDAEGVKPMESVLEQTPEAVLPGAQLLWNYYLCHNETDRASHWQRRYLEQSAALQAAREERGELLPSDPLIEHALPADALSALTAQLNTVPGLTRAYLVRKVTRHFPERPLYVLGFKSGRWWQMYDGANAHALTHRIRQEVRFPGDALIVNLDGPNQRLAHRLPAVKGSRII
jgi:Zn-dependent protease with chaperone function